MKTARKKDGEEILLCGLLSKKEAAQRIAGGIRHLHSSILGERDACARVTAESLRRGEPLSYSWEQPAQTEEVTISSSAERYQLSSRLIQNPIVAGRRKVRERLEVTLEELLTNSLYHAYRDGNGEEKYPRKSPVQLEPAETLHMRYSISPEGVYLSLRDQGGAFPFEAIASAFRRCYGEGPQSQIEGKQGGAGLGIYMVFEAATHFKAVCAPGKSTVISVWLSDRRGDDPDNFSFNYYNIKE